MSSKHEWSDLLLLRFTFAMVDAKFWTEIGVTLDLMCIIFPSVVLSRSDDLDALQKTMLSTCIVYGALHIVASWMLWIIFINRMKLELWKTWVVLYSFAHGTFFLGWILAVVIESRKGNAEGVVIACLLFLTFRIVIGKQYNQAVQIRFTFDEGRDELIEAARRRKVKVSEGHTKQDGSSNEGGALNEIL